MASAPPSPTTIPLPSSPDGESSRTLVDCPDADIIIHSCDSQQFRVLKLYITKCSPVLNKQIQVISDPSHSTSSSDVNTPLLPVVQLSDNGSILSSLLTFIFPVPPILPPTFEEIMELLSVAQKYEMESVLVHIRGFIALQDPPFIHPENAFHIYSLAQKYGLRQEAAKAARITLTFTLTIEDLEDKLDVLPGAYLYELWKYHQNVQQNLLSTIDDFILSAARGTLTRLRCARTESGIPRWLNGYIHSMTRALSFFDPVEFQTALTRHFKEDGINKRFGCDFCASISAQTIRRFWTALTSFVNENIAEVSVISLNPHAFCIKYNLQAESAMNILGPGWEICSQHHTCTSGAILPLPEGLSISGTDIILQSSDHVNFPVHKSILASSSQVFRDMFLLPQPSNELVSGLPVLHMPEDAELVRSLITVLYPIPSEIPAQYDRVLALLAASQKYDMPAVQFSIRAEVNYKNLAVPTGDESFRAYAIASKHRLAAETSTAAIRTLDYSLTFESLGSELQHFEGWALRDLANFRKSRRKEVISCLNSFLDAHSGPSKIWVGRHCHEAEDEWGLGSRRKHGIPSASKSNPVLPTWLRDFFTAQIAELKKSTDALIQPSSIREKYLTALRAHMGSGRSSDGCTSCLEVYVHRGEGYCVELERKLAQARDQASSKSLFESVLTPEYSLSAGA